MFFGNSPEMSCGGLPPPPYKLVSDCDLKKSHKGYLRRSFFQSFHKVIKRPSKVTLFEKCSCSLSRQCKLKNVLVSSQANVNFQTCYKYCWEIMNIQ
jgi:hypothetical protein